MILKLNFHVIIMLLQLLQDNFELNFPRNYILLLLLQDDF